MRMKSYKRFSTVENTVIKLSNAELRNRLFEIVEKADRPLDINHIAKEMGMSWWPTFKLITEILLEELKVHPEALEELPFVLIKSTKSFLIFPRRLWPIEKVPA